VLAGLTDSTLTTLQRVPHAAARFVLDLRPRDRVTAALQTLHWPPLPVHQCITYKLCVLMHGVTFRYAPTNLQHAVVVAPLSTLPGRAHPLTQQTVRYPRRLVVGEVQSVFSRWTTSLEPTSCITPRQNTVCSATFKKHLKAIFLRRLSTIAISFLVRIHFIFCCSVPLSILL